MKWELRTKAAGQWLKLKGEGHSQRLWERIAVKKKKGGRVAGKQRGPENVQRDELASEVLEHSLKTGEAPEEDQRKALRAVDTEGSEQFRRGKRGKGYKGGRVTWTSVLQQG